jgi:hypothetical protein
MNILFSQFPVAIKFMGFIHATGAIEAEKS